MFPSPTKRLSLTIAISIAAITTSDLAADTLPTSQPATTTTTPASAPATQRGMPTLVAETFLDNIEGVTPEQREAARKILRDYARADRDYQNANFQTWFDALQARSKAQQEKNADSDEKLAAAEKTIAKITAELQDLRTKMLADLEKALPADAYQKLKTKFPEIKNPRLVANFSRGTTQPTTRPAPMRTALEAVVERLELSADERTAADKFVKDYRKAINNWDIANSASYSEVRRAAIAATGTNDDELKKSTTAALNKFEDEREALRINLEKQLEKVLPPDQFKIAKPFINPPRRPLPQIRPVLAPTGTAMQPLTAAQMESITKILGDLKTAMDNAEKVDPKNDAARQTIYMDHYLQLTLVLTQDQFAQFAAIMTKIQRPTTTQPATQAGSQTAPASRP